MQKNSNKSENTENNDRKIKITCIFCNTNTSVHNNFGD